MNDNIFRYRTDNTRVLEELSENYIYFTNREKLNDPFDCYPNMIQVNEDVNELLSSFSKRVESDYSLSASQRKEIIDYFSQNPKELLSLTVISKEKTLNSMGFACFSKQATNLLMWSHYSNFHRGICLEFDTTLDKNFFKYLSGMDYLEEMPKFIFPAKKESEIFEKVLTTKHKCWDSEEELRLVRDEYGSYKFNPTCLRNIYFGLKAEETFIQQVISSTRNYPHLNHYRSSPSRDKFGLTFEKI